LSRRLQIVAATFLLSLAGVFSAAFGSLSSTMPELLVAWQIHRPTVDGSPFSLPYPRWFIDLHWHLAGERQLERINRTSTAVADFMLGVELQKDVMRLPIDQARFSDLTTHYVCNAPPGIRDLAWVTKFSSSSEAPTYVAALKACGRQ
jgi:hypothetical protein